MGAGRARAEDRVDPAVGISVLAKPGDRVERGQPLAVLHLKTRDASIEERVRAAYVISDAPPAPRPLFIARIP
jgi:thymidine phosphorylase